MCNLAKRRLARLRIYVAGREGFWYSDQMSQVNLIKLRSTSSEHVIWTSKNKKKVERKLELKKFDPTTRKREIFKEVKK